ncbi:unannotated protein [freshwater metagenome]|uniref:Unannotated protein n=1 Tax=freshwater metagenome TaxID=449393 RepID=A0A6J7KIV1_9ZZZZ
MVWAIDDRDAVGGLAVGALDLLVPLMADQQDAIALVGEPTRLGMNLGDQRTRGVDGLEPSLGSLGVHRGRHAVGGEHHGAAFRHLLDLVDEDGPRRLESLNYVPVVHDLLAHVNRRTVEVERRLHCEHGPVDPRAVAARGGQQNTTDRGCDSFT